MMSSRPVFSFRQLRHQIVYRPPSNITASVCLPRSSNVLGQFRPSPLEKATIHNLHQHFLLFRRQFLYRLNRYLEW